MQETQGAHFFNAGVACGYDEAREKLVPLKDALHLMMHAIFSDLPNDAHILCVGAGTGDELLSLAQTFPDWRFTVVEPAAKMMQICQQKATALGIASRCIFHQDYVSSLESSHRFDAATAILVSQFILARDERIRFFSDIAKRLKPQGLLVNADFSANLLGEKYPELLNLWLATHRRAGLNFTGDYLGRDVAVSVAEDIEDILISGGFSKPVSFYQAILIHAWYSVLA